MTSTKPAANKRHPSRQVVPGRGGSRQRWREGTEWVIEGEARGLSPGEQHHSLMPSHLLTPHPICLGHVAADHHHPPPLPHTAVLPGRPETEPRLLGFGFLAQTRSLASHWRTRGPPATFVIPIRTHYLLSPPYSSISCGTPKTKPRKLGFGSGHVRS